MRIQYRGLLFPAALILLGALVVPGCGGSGSSSPAGSNTSGITAAATLSGNVVNITAHTDRSDIASVWATVTGASGNVTLSGSGQDWSGSVAVTAQPNTLVTIQVFARDSLGNDIGPTSIQVRMGEYGTEPTVTGVVVDRESNLPIQGATVTIGSQSTATNSSGRFVITGLLAGTTHECVIAKSGFEETRVTVNIVAGTTDLDRITLTATQDLPPPAPVFP